MQTTKPPRCKPGRFSFGQRATPRDPSEGLSSLLIGLHYADMSDAKAELAIRSRYGLLRDIVPIYSLLQLVPNLAAIGLILWMSDWGVPTNPILLMAIMLGWVFQFASRPTVMAVSEGQAAWIGAVLEAQDIYEKSDPDGCWRLVDAKWWDHLPHQFIRFDQREQWTVVAPRDVMETIRSSIELVEEHTELNAESLPPVLEPVEPEPEPDLPWHVKGPGIVLGTMCVAAFLAAMFTGGIGSMSEWGVSAAALAAGRIETLVLHMFAHGSVMHLVMNMTALAAIGATLTSRLGTFPFSWLRFWAVFAFSAFAGAAIYLALHPTGSVPMVGASGGLYGLIGLLIRLPEAGEPMLEITSRNIRRVAWDLVKQNAFLFALLALMSWSSGSAGGLAWEAHLGGFLFGLLVGPKLLPHSPVPVEATGAVNSVVASTD